MKKITFSTFSKNNKRLHQLLLFMKLTALGILICIMQVSATTYGQHLNMTEKKISYEKLFKKIEQHSGYTFVYDPDLLAAFPDLNIELNDASIRNVMDKIIADKPLDYNIIDKTVVIRRKNSSSIVLANYYITGRVIGENGQTLAGISIKVKGTNIGWTTDSKGEFKALVGTKDAILQFSYVGYETQEIYVSKIKSPLIVRLKEDISKLDEVQVIAYGQTTRRLNTGDQTTVTAKDIEKYPVNNVLSVLQGTVPGMAISQGTGQSGSTYKVNIRGQNGINTATDPLYVIDGIPYQGGSYTSQKSNYLGSNGQAYDALNFINPLDIESINVLKDADATAIYGSRGANGVILITTKKGKAGDTRVTFNVYNGISSAVMVPQFMNTQQYLQMRHEALKNDNKVVGTSDPDLNGTWDTTRYTNWPKLLLGGTGRSTNAQASISGGSSNLQYLVSGNFRDVSNIQTLIGGGDKTSSLHFNLNSASNNNRFTMAFTGGYTYDNNNIPSADLSRYDNIAPDAPALFNPNGTLNFQNGTFFNPIAARNLLANTSVSNVTSSMVLAYKILKGLTLQATFGYNKQSINEFLGMPTASFQPSSIALGNKGSSNFTYDNTIFWSVEPQVNYTTKIGKGRLDATVGESLQKRNLDYNTQSVIGYNSDLLLNNIGAGTTIQSVLFNIAKYKYNAAFGRINYNWNDKYIFNLSGRYDGSSKFGENREFHFFPAAGAAWLFSSEDFVHNSAPFISFGKLRLSYGVTGNDQIGSYSYLENYSIISTAQAAAYQGVQGILPGNLPNADLSWETTKKANLGLEVQFIKGRIGLDANYFINRTNGTLADVPLSTTTGFTSITQNIDALIQNKGFDITLNTVNIQHKDFSWSSSFLFTRQRNALLRYPNLNPAYVNQLGRAINVLYLNRYAGVNPQTGLYQYYDRTGKVVNAYAANGNDQVALVDLNPDYFGAVSNTFNYKGFSFSFLFRYIKQEGNSTMGQILSNGMATPGYGGINFPAAVLDRWQKPGDVATYEMYSSSLGNAYSRQSSFNKTVDAYYGDASYIRLQNASLGYVFPSLIIDRLHLKNLKVYVQGENLLTITGYKLSDPETQNYLRMPPLRTIIVGLQVTL